MSWTSRLVAPRWRSPTIAHYKVPRYIKFTDSFPMTITGKIQKFKMRETSIVELGLNEAAQVRSA